MTIDVDVLVRATRAVAESLAVPFRFDTISENATRRSQLVPLTASECPLLVETSVRPHALGNRPTVAQVLVQREFQDFGANVGIDSQRGSL